MTTTNRDAGESAAPAGERYTRTRRFDLAFALTVALFFLWGVANNLNDILIAHFKDVFTLTDFSAGLIQSAFYLGYFCLAAPAALVMRARGYRDAVMIGLLLYGAGALLFWPAAATLSYPFFLFALFVIAAGLAFLETSANPLVARLGPEAGAARRLSFAQAFNPLGSIAGVVVGRNFILPAKGAELAHLSAADLAAYRLSEAASVQEPYLLIGLGVLAWALLIRVTPFPAVATAREVEGAVGTPDGIGQVLKLARVRFGVVAQFFYVGAQVGIWSFLIRYVQSAMPGSAARTGATYLTISLALFMVGRFLGAALLTRVRPLALLAGFAAFNALLCLFAAAGGGAAGVAALVVSSFFMSVMYPIIFAETVAGLGAQTKSASALLVMAIVGGAVFPALMGLLSDRTGSIAAAMTVPAAGFLVVLGFGLVYARRSR